MQLILGLLPVMIELGDWLGGRPEVLGTCYSAQARTRGSTGQISYIGPNGLYKVINKSQHTLSFQALPFCPNRKPLFGNLKQPIGRRRGN